MGKLKVLVVDDDPDIRRLVEMVLSREGFLATSVESAAEAYKKVAASKPDLIVLDLQLPDEDGFTICKKIRSDPSTANIPILMLTVQSVDSYKIAGLELGADDYVIKPFNQAELAARIKAILRRTHAKEERQPTLDDGGLVVHLDKHIVESGGKIVDLSPKEFDLLVCLMKSKGNVMTREALCESVWGHEYYQNTRTVDVHVGRLRKKLGKVGDKIETIERIGYRYAFDKS
jgi:two-component system alkaline phosphatase synthesis response regulator PhoP